MVFGVEIACVVLETAPIPYLSFLAPTLPYQGQERRGSLERRSSSGSISGQNGGNPLIGSITRDEVFNLLEEKADRKDLERRMANIMTR